MSGALQHVEDDEPRCYICRDPAVGPCASCRKLVCGDCCVLTEGGVDTWAICTRCERKKGRSLASAWNSITVALLAMLVLLALAATAVVLFSRP